MQRRLRRILGKRTMKSQLSILVGLLMVTKEGTLDYVIHINGNTLLISMYSTWCRFDIWYTCTTQKAPCPGAKTSWRISSRNVNRCTLARRCLWGSDVLLAIVGFWFVVKHAGDTKGWGSGLWSDIVLIVRQYNRYVWLKSQKATK